MNKTVIRLNGAGGKLDEIVLADHDATVEAIQQAVVTLATPCTLLAGDTITITEED